MPQAKTSAGPLAKYRENARSELRWFAPAAGLINLLLLLEVVNRFHHALTPINHGLARVLATALIVNLAGAAAVAWLAAVRHWQNFLSPILKADLLISLVPFAMAALRNGEKARVFHLFAFAYVIFLLCRMAELLFFAAQNAAATTVHLPVIVFAAAFIVYGGLTPWMALASTPQGDEIHFTVLTHSLIFDHDFDVGNNYANGDYKEEYPPPSPGAMRGYPYAFMERDNIVYVPHEPHVVRNSHGQLMLEHDPGFSMLLVPGYALDKREGALFTISLIGAIGAAGVFELATLLGAAIVPALLIVIMFCFACPFWTHTQTAFSDIAGATGSVWIALQFFRYRRREDNRYLLLAGILIAILPWLNIRYWSLAGPAFLVLNAWVLHREWGRWGCVVGKMALLGVPSLVGLCSFALFDKHFFNTYLPNKSMLLYNQMYPQFGSQPLRGFIGILFDQSYGLLPVAPIYIAVFAGMIVLFHRDRWGFWALLLPALGYVPFISTSKVWFGGWCAPGRLVMSAVLPMVPAAALVLDRKVRWVVAVLAAWGLFVAVLFTVNPFLRMPSVWDFYQMSMLVEFFHDHIHSPLYSILSVYPNMMLARTQDWLRGWFWLLVFGVGTWAWARSARTRAEEPTRS